RVQVATADDDEVLDAAGDDELAVDERAEVARAQPGAVVGLRRDRGAESLGRGIRPVPVALRDARSAHEDLADGARLGAPARLRVDDRDLVAGRRRPAAAQ